MLMLGRKRRGLAAKPHACSVVRRYLHKHIARNPKKKRNPNPSRSSPIVFAPVPPKAAPCLNEASLFYETGAPTIEAGSERRALL